VRKANTTHTCTHTHTHLCRHSVEFNILYKHTKLSEIKSFAPYQKT